MGNFASLLPSIVLDRPYREGRKIDVQGGQVRNRILESNIGKAGRTKRDVVRLLLDDIDAVTGQPRAEALDDAASFAATDETGRRRLLLGRFTPIRALSFAELQMPNRWSIVSPRPRPVYVTVGGIGGAIVIAQRTIDDDERASMALTEDLGLFAVQKVAPVDPRFIRVTAPPLEVPAVAQYVNVEIERLIVSFRPDQDFVQVMQADGTVYTESWTKMLQSNDQRDTAAINILRRDFPTQWMYTTLVPGEKNDEARFPNAPAQAASEIMQPRALTLDDRHGRPQTFNVVEQLMSGADYNRLLAQERWASATAALTRAPNEHRQYYTDNALMGAQEHADMQERLARERRWAPASPQHLVALKDVRDVLESVDACSQQQPVPVSAALDDEAVLFVDSDDDV